jgi:superfamily II DNA or RNA helicase
VSDKLKAHLTLQGAARLQPMLGTEITELLKHIGHEAMHPQVMANLIVSSQSAAVILKNATIRELLIDRLEEDEARDLCAVLGAATAIPRTTLKNFNFQRPVALARLFEWFRVPYSEELEQIGEPSRKFGSEEKLGVYQYAAYRELRKILDLPESRVLVHMPFGAGKLRTVITAVLEAYRSDSDDKNILWLSADTCLCEEAFREFEKVWRQLGLRDVIGYRLFGGRKIPPLTMVSNAFVVADIDSLIKAYDVWKTNGVDAKDSLGDFGGRLKCVVLGDAEHVLLKDVLDIIEKLQSDRAQFNIVGISAGSGFDVHGNGTQRIVHDYFNGTFVEMDEDDPPSALRRIGDTDPFEVFPIASPVSQLPVSTNAAAISDELAEALASNVDRNIFLMAKIAEVLTDEHKIVLYTATALQAKLFAELLTMKGMPSTAITGDMPAERRTQGQARFHSDDDQQVLCIHGDLVSASTVENITAVIIALPTSSAALLHEMVGRLVTNRGNDAHPLKVYTIQDPVPAFLSLVENLDRWDHMSHRS